MHNDSVYSIILFFPFVSPCILLKIKVYAFSRKEIKVYVHKTAMLLLKTCCVTCFAAWLYLFPFNGGGIALKRIIHISKNNK